MGQIRPSSHVGHTHIKGKSRVYAIRTSYQVAEAGMFLLCLALAFMQLREIFRDYWSHVTTSSIKEEKVKIHEMPLITVCPMSGYKGDINFTDFEEDFIANTFDKEEIFRDNEVFYTNSFKLPYD